MKAYNVNDIRERVKNISIVGRLDFVFTNAKAIDNADEESIVWIKKITPNQLLRIQRTKAKYIVAETSISKEINLQKSKCLILSDNPKLTFLRILKAFFVEKEAYHTHHSAIIDPLAKISEHVTIGPNTYIGKSSIGSGTILHGNCYIYDHVIIGENVTISAGCVIGSAGFGYAENEDGEYESFPQLGGVQIHANVEIGANSTIDRGTLTDTIIGEGVKIDNLVHIGHNVVIGKNSIITANTTISGSVKIGEGVWIAPSASIINQIKIGDNSTIGIGSVAVKSIPMNEIWNGFPAKPVNEYLRQEKFLKKQVK
jgi:UDP-3-O-[3-hydroxymyristoyl] glucosamine N-acyltransferase